MIQIINISLIPSDNKPVINVSQYDNGLRVLRFNIFDDIEMEVLHEFDGETVTCNIRKNDNNIVVITGTIETETTEEAETSYVKVVLTDQACACVGSNYGEISLSSGDDVIGTCNFKLIVERSPLAGGVDSQSEIDNLTTQIEEIAEQVIGEDYYTKLEVDGLIDEVESEIPTKTSQLTNDSGFITEEDIPTIPTKTSQLTNDSGFITEEDIPTIPTKTSQLTNDSGFTTIDDDATVSDKTWSSEKINEELINILPTGTASGSIANFNTALAWPLELVAEFGANVSGVSALNLVKCSTNLWNEIWESGAFNGATGQPTASSAFSRSVNFIKVNGGSNIYFNVEDINSTNNFFIWEYDEDYQFLPSYNTISSNGVITLKNNCQYIKVSYRRPYSEISDYSVSINYPSSDTTYHAYNGTTTIINLGDTYYNGGKVTIDKDGHRTLTADGQTVNLPDDGPVNALVGVNNVYCDTGDTTVQYKDTIQNYIDTRVNAVSNRSLSMLRTLETLEKSTTLERGETDDQK